MTVTIYDEPKVTLLSRPEFINPLAGQWETDVEGGPALSEFAGRLCYLSFGEDVDLGAHKTIKGRQGNLPYLTNIKKQGHGSVLEHANYSVLVEQISRSLSHELVRHRAGFAFSMLSQRYVDESQVAFILPPEILPGSRAYNLFYASCVKSMELYTALLGDMMEQVKATDGAGTMAKKRARQSARSVLPNSAETKIVVTANIRAWRAMLELRGNPGADREIRAYAVANAKLLAAEAPNFFADMEVIIDTDGFESLRFGFHKV